MNDYKCGDLYYALGSCARLVPAWDAIVGRAEPHLRRLTASWVQAHTDLFCDLVPEAMEIALGALGYAPVSRADLPYFTEGVLMPRIYGDFYSEPHNELYWTLRTIWKRRDPEPFIYFPVLVLACRQPAFALKVQAAFREMVRA